MLEEAGLGDWGADAARTQEPGKGNDDMEEKYDKVVPLLMITKPGIA